MSAVVRTLGQSSVAKSIYACCLPADVEGLKPVAYSLFFIFIFLLWKEPASEEAGGLTGTAAPNSVHQRCKHHQSSRQCTFVVYTKREDRQTVFELREDSKSY